MIYHIQKKLPKTWVFVKVNMLHHGVIYFGNSIFNNRQANLINNFR